MSILTSRDYYKPFEYPEAFEFWLTQQQSFWLHTEVNMERDISDWKFNLTDDERLIVGNILKSFVQSEVLIGDYWRFIAKAFPKPEISMMATAFSNSETIHIAAYAYLNDTLGLQDFKVFLEDEIAMERLNVLTMPPKLNTLNTLEGRKELARSIAVFSAFAEGVALFSAFTILLSFSQRGLLRGLGEIIEWSIRDECVVEGTEVLTSRGFVKIEELREDDLVANYHPDQSVSFTEYEKTADFISDESYVFEKRNMHQHVSSGHRVVYETNRGNLLVTKAENASFNAGNKVIHGGYKSGEVHELSDMDRLRIAVQADAYIQTRSTVSDTITFVFRKERKIARLEGILERLNVSFRKTKDKSGGTRICFLSAVAEFTKDYSLFDLEDKSHLWCQAFVDEVVEWDGHVRKDTEAVIYCNTNKQSVDFMQAVVSCAGYSATLSTTNDTRKESYKMYYRLSINKSRNSTGRSVVKTKVTTPHRFIGIAVPSTFIIIRSRGKVSVTGNCNHARGGVWLYKTFMAENQDITGIKKEVYDAARTCVQIEHKFIDSVFEGRTLPNCNPVDLKEFIKQRANDKLVELGLKPNYKAIDSEKVNSLRWFNLASAGDQHADFFASRVTQYAKTDNWETMWGELDNEK